MHVWAIALSKLRYLSGLGLGRFSIKRLACFLSITMTIWAGLSTVSAQSAPVHLPQPQTDLNSSMQHLVDPSQTLSAEAALKDLRAGKFQPFRAPNIQRDMSQSIHWLHVELHNEARTPGVWVYDAGIRTAFLAEIFLVQGDRIERVLHIANGSRNLPRDQNLNGVVAAIPLAPGAAVDILVRLRLSTDYSLLPTVADRDTYYRLRTGQSQWHFLFYGIILTMTVVGVLASYSLQFRAPLWYGGMMLSTMFWFLHMDGYAYTLIWSGDNYLNNLVVRPIFGLVCVFAGQFVISLFDLQRTHRTLYRVVQVAMVVAVAIAASALISDHRLVLAGYFAVGFIATMIYFASGIVGIVRRWDGSLQILIGSGAVLASSLVAASRIIDPALTPPLKEIEVLRLATMVEAACFLLAIWYRVSETRRAEAEASAQAIELLQSKVALTAELRRSDEEYSRAALLAERRRQTLAFATHDLSQPLASLRLTLYRSSGLPHHDRETLEKHCSYLQSIVETYLDDAEDAETQPAPVGRSEVFPARLILDATHAMYANEAERKGITLRCVPSSLHLSGDPLVTIRIMSNLVANALQHSGSDKVLFGCRASGDHVRLLVCDRGTGMSSAQLDALFAPGQKGELSEGKGLGLAIARDLAEGLGVPLTANSQKNRGTSFCLMLARADAAKVGVGRA